MTRRFVRGRWLLTAAVVAVCAVVTRADLPRWRNTFSLCDAALRVGPHYVTHNNRGAAYLKKGELQRALADFDAAIALKPDFAKALSNRGGVRIDLGDYTAALQDCAEAIRCDPTFASAWNNRGNAYNRLGDFAQALVDYNQAIKLRPDVAIHYNNRAAVFFGLKQYSQAWADIQECERRGGQPHPGLVQALREALPQPLL